MARVIANSTLDMCSATETSSSQSYSTPKQKSDGCRTARNLLFVCCIMCLFTCGQPMAMKMQCQKFGNEHLIAENGCEVVRVAVNVCSGFCRSFSFYDPESEKVTVLGKCCRMVESEWVNVTLRCASGPKVVRLPSATECRCFDCAVAR